MPKKPDYAKLVFNVPNVMYISYEELLELAQKAIDNRKCHFELISPGESTQTCQSTAATKEPPLNEK